MIVDRHIVGPAPGDATPARRDTQPDRAAWLREMEKQELTAWLSHPVAVPVPAAPVVYARIDPPAVSADADTPVLGDDAAAVPRLGRDGAAPTATDGAASRGEGRPGDAGAEPARSSDRHGDDAGTGSDGVTAAGSVAAAGSAAPTVPAELAAVVMAVLAQGTGTEGNVGQSSQAPVQGVAGVTPGSVAAPQPTTTGFASPPGMQVTAAVPRPAQPDARRAQAEVQQEAGEVRGRPTARPDQATGPGHALPPLRIHTMRTAAGVRVWIGADEAAGLGGQQLQLAAMDIRRLLRDQGVALASLTYNGESVFEADDPPEASGTLRERAAPAPRTRAMGGIGPHNRT